MGRLFKDSKLYVMSEGDGPSEYVREGLLFELDCTKASAGETTWKSCDGRQAKPLEFKSVDLYSSSEISISKDGDGVKLYLGNSFSRSFASQKIVDYKYDAGVVFELCLKIKDSSFGINVNIEDDKGLTNTINIHPAEINYYENDISKWSRNVTLNRDELYTVAATTDGSIYINGSLLPQSRMMLVAQNDEMSQIPSVQGAMTIMGFDATLYSMRIYSAESNFGVEQSQFNAEVDQKRFASFNNK